MPYVSADRDTLANASCPQNPNHLNEVAKHTPTNANPDGIRVRKLRKEFCTGNLKKPWGLQKHGDVWLLMFKGIVAKRPHALAYCKVKGHAKNAQVDSGEVPLEQAIGNRKSDHAATAVARMFGTSIPNISSELYAI